MNKQKDTDKKLDKDPPNNPIDREQMIQDVMAYTGCTRPVATEFVDRLLATGKK